MINNLWISNLFHITCLYPQLIADIPPIWCYIRSKLRIYIPVTALSYLYSSPPPVSKLSRCQPIVNLFKEGLTLIIQNLTKSNYIDYFINVVSNLDSSVIGIVGLLGLPVVIVHSVLVFTTSLTKRPFL